MCTYLRWRQNRPITKSGTILLLWPCISGPLFFSLSLFCLTMNTMKSSNHRIFSSNNNKMCSTSRFKLSIEKKTKKKKQWGRWRKWTNCRRTFWHRWPRQGTKQKLFIPRERNQILIENSLYRVLSVGNPSFPPPLARARQSTNVYLFASDDIGNVVI